MARSSWTCLLTLEELLARFIWFYTVDFVWGNEVVSPRLGSRFFSVVPAFEKLRGRHSVRLHIEDPYELERNLHCVLSEEAEARLRKAFQNAYVALQDGETPVGLRPGESPKQPAVEASARHASKDAPASRSGSEAVLSQAVPDVKAVRAGSTESFASASTTASSTSGGGILSGGEFQSSGAEHSDGGPPECRRGEAEDDDEDEEKKKEVVTPHGGGRSLALLTVQDLEGRIGATQSEPARVISLEAAMTDWVPTPFMAKQFAARSTNKIAARVSMACQVY